MGLFDDPVGVGYWLMGIWNAHAPLIIICAGGLLGVIIIYRKFGHKTQSNEPLTTIDESDKSGLMHVNEIEKDQEGTAFLMFERANGDVENRQIEQPFVFFLEDNQIERHHINPRGSYSCLGPARTFDDYKPSQDEMKKVVAFTEQQIRQLRTGGYNLDKARRHWRTFLLILGLAAMVGLGLGLAIKAGIHH